MRVPPFSTPAGARQAHIWRRSPHAARRRGATRCWDVVGNQAGCGGSLGDREPFLVEATRARWTAARVRSGAPMARSARTEDYSPGFRPVGDAGSEEVGEAGVPSGAVSSMRIEMYPPCLSVY